MRGRHHPGPSKFCNRDRLGESFVNLALKQTSTLHSVFIAFGYGMVPPPAGNGVLRLTAYFMLAHLLHDGHEPLNC